ncbi:MAG TPA: glycoside hydrolase domain-containing protein, partial [Nevskiaceae bacterium]|nr:glycoside hydrolase domain-containing protein [Nevskiaceae bacterium]
GNEDDLQAPYLYAFLGAPWKNAVVARSASSIYTPTPLGLPGNDDLGALSGWLVWNMLGVYPFNPGTPLFVIGSPQFEHAVMRRPSGDLRIDAPGAAEFVTGTTLNNNPLARTWFVLPRAATTLALDTAALPDMNWGADASAAPPSISSGTLADFGCVQ